MNEKPRQIPLDLPVAERLEAEDFLVSPSNEAAFNRIEAWPEWPDPILVLIGPESSGKSHLAAIWAVKARAWTIKAADITMDRVPHLVSNGALVIEDADRGVDEHALFHLLNASREKRGFACPVTGTGNRALGLPRRTNCARRKQRISARKAGDRAFRSDWRQAMQSRFASIGSGLEAVPRTGCATDVHRKLGGNTR